MNEQLGETTHNTIEKCRPGDVFELPDSLHLQQFETEIANRFITCEREAEIHDNTWEARRSLVDMIRPKGYYGPIKNYVLTVMSDPYERLFDVNKRGKKYSKEATIPRVRTKFAERTMETIIGFTLTAETKKGYISTEVYYAPPPENTTTGARATSNTGGVVNRYLTATEIMPKASEIETPVKSGVGQVAVKSYLTKSDYRATKDNLFS